MNKHTFTKRNRVSVFESLGGMDYAAMKSDIERWDDGTEGYITIHKVGKGKSPEELGYYYGVILPAAFEALKDNGELSIAIAVKGQSLELPLDINTTDTLLKWRYGKWLGEFKGKGDMNMAECAAFMNWAILWLATYYNCQIPPANKDWRQK